MFEIKDFVEIDGDLYLLSTVKLPCDYSGYRYETMLFRVIGDEIDYRELFCRRYFTRMEAEYSHRHLLRILNAREKIFGGV